MHGNELYDTLYGRLEEVAGAFVTIEEYCNFSDLSVGDMLLPKDDMIALRKLNLFVKSDKFKEMSDYANQVSNHLDDMYDE